MEIRLSGLVGYIFKFCLCLFVFCVCVCGADGGKEVQTLVLGL